MILATTSGGNPSPPAPMEGNATDDAFSLSHSFMMFVIISSIPYFTEEEKLLFCLTILLKATRC